MKLRLGRKPAFNLEEIEREAQAEIDQRVKLGKPAPEEWKGLANRAVRDADVPGRPRDFSPPAPARAPVAAAPAPALEEVEAPAPAVRAKPAAAKKPAAATKTGTAAKSTAAAKKTGAAAKKTAKKAPAAKAARPKS